jgi:hypothetical protein
MFRQTLASMTSPAPIKKRLWELQQQISAIQAANDLDRSKPRGLSSRHNELDRKQRLRLIVEELSELKNALPDADK